MNRGQSKEPSLADLGLDDDIPGMPKQIRKASRCQTCNSILEFGLNECFDCAEIRNSSSTSTRITNARAIEYVESSWFLKKLKRIAKLFIFTVLGLIVLGFFASFNTPLNPSSLDKFNSIESQFSAWDGSHKNLTAYIKGTMNDPKSFEHVETKYFNQSTHLIVITHFRGKNAFGGVITTYAKAKVGLDGKILEILSE